ncbi:DUF3419 family protein [Streptomyces sp. RPT161]|uniref:DUF3419 family protein n=1 Tax=Streptomyces sp. RPT161 TaxID=3015993 RepID=UPI0022B8B597|nr:DUF3419 family protein [Streptomyces sp. RPT161]
MRETPWSTGRILTAQSGGPRLLFGRMYEDPRIELRAFPAAARVLCIASAGDMAAALAHAGHDVTAVDINPRQLAYAADRVTHGAPARTGTAERLTSVGRRAAAVLPGWRPTELAAFLELNDPARQSAWWRTRLDGPGLRLLMGVALRPAGPLAALLRPGFRGVVPTRFDAVLRQRIAGTVARHPNADNPLLRLLLLGRAPDPAPATGVRFMHTEVAEHLESVTPGSYDAVTLSNVLDGPGGSYARRLRAAVERAVRPGGLAVLRSLRGSGRPTDDRCPLWGTVRLIHTGGSR